MKKIFKANDELARIFEKFEFIEVTDELDKIKGKKMFKHPASRNKYIYFDYINIRVLSNKSYVESVFEIDEEELRNTLLFFLLKPSELKHIAPDNHFSFNSITSRLKMIKKELKNPKLKESKKSSYEEILKIYENIEL